MEKKNVQVFVIYRSSVLGIYPAHYSHDYPLSSMMDMHLYVDEDVVLVEYVDGKRTRIVDVVNGEYHERT